MVCREFINLLKMIGMDHLQVSLMIPDGLLMLDNLVFQVLNQGFMRLQLSFGHVAISRRRLKRSFHLIMLLLDLIYFGSVTVDDGLVLVDFVP
jgi:hypothetical protein